MAAVWRPTRAILEHEKLKTRIERVKENRLGKPCKLKILRCWNWIFVLGGTERFQIWCSQQKVATDAYQIAPPNHRKMLKIFVVGRNFRLVKLKLERECDSKLIDPEISTASYGNYFHGFRSKVPVFLNVPNLTSDEKRYPAKWEQPAPEIFRECITAWV